MPCSLRASLVPLQDLMDAPMKFSCLQSQSCLLLILFGGQGILLLATVSSKAYALGKVLLLLWWKQREILASPLSVYFPFKSVSKILPNGHFTLKVAASSYLLTVDSPIHCSLMGDQYSFWLFALI